MHVVIVERDALVRADLTELAVDRYGRDNVEVASALDEMARLVERAAGPVILLANARSEDVQRTGMAESVARKGGGIVITNEKHSRIRMSREAPNWAFVARPFTSAMIVKALNEVHHAPPRLPERPSETPLPEA